MPVYLCLRFECRRFGYTLSAEYYTLALAFQFPAAAPDNKHPPVLPGFSASRAVLHGRFSGRTASFIVQFFCCPAALFLQAAKSADGPDGVYGMAHDQLASYISAGLVQEVPDGTFQEADYSPAAVQACCADGKKYALPIAVETNALFYNTKKVPVSYTHLTLPTN